MPDLSGKTIVVTRPAHQSKELADLISANGGSAFLFPVMEILDPTDSEPLLKLIARLPDFDMAIFVSANAVRAAMKFIETRGELPATMKLAVVGDATARALASFGRVADIYPQTKFDSEALLAVEEMNNVSGKRIIIFRGDGGRELIADTLRQRGATVEYAECYQRVKPDNELTLLLSCLEQGQIDAIVVMSNQGLQNLWEMVGIQGQRDLQNCQLIVISGRTVELAEELGFLNKPKLASIASDQAILDVLGKC
ncbi:MAG: uroporphyrinogen-III synthase [Gammaproteobacteria bacterium]|nr:uroporphyrinogen-III synthase [Gammaproteobacteria bacterium]